MVNFLTRVTEHSKTTIYNFITNIEPNNLNVTGVITHISDHDGKILKLLNLEPENINLITKQEWKFDKNNTHIIFFKQLSSECWFDIIPCVSLLKYDNFYKVFKYYFDVNFPNLYNTEIQYY